MNAPPTLDDVASALADVLDTPVAEIEIDTPLTELGLESFTAVRLRRRIREDLGLDLPLTAFLGAATVRSLVASATGAADDRSGAGGESFPLTPKQSAYWGGRDPALPAGPALPFAADVAALRGHRFIRSRVSLPADEWSALRERAARHGLSPTGTLLAAFGLTPTRWGATEPFSLNTTLFGRPGLPELDGVEGGFTTTLLDGAPALDPLGRAGFADCAGQVNRRFWTAMEHRTVSGTEARRAGREPPVMPRYPVGFTSGLGLTDGDGDLAGWLGEEVFGVSRTPPGTARPHRLAQDGALVLCGDAVEGAFPEGFVAAMLDAHVRPLRRLARDEDAWRDPGLDTVARAAPAAGAHFTADVLDPGPVAEALRGDPLVHSLDLTSSTVGTP